MNAPKRPNLAIDAGFLAARAIRRALDVRERERIREEIRREIEWCNRFVAEHGSFADMVREEFGDEGDAPASV